MISRGLKIIITVSLAGALLACGGAAGQRQQAQVQPSKPATVESLKEERAFRSIGGLKSEVKARVLHKGKRLGSFKGAITMRPPDSFRIRLFGLMGDAAADVVRTGDYVEVFVPRYNTIFKGWAPSISDPSGAQYAMEDTPAGPVLVVSPLKSKASKPVVRHYFDKSTGAHTGTTAFVSGKKALDIGYSEYQGSLPTKISIEFAEGMAVELTLVNPSSSKEVDEKFFVPFDDTGRKIMPLEALILPGAEK